MSNNVGGLAVGPNDAHGGNLLVGDGIDPPLQLDEKLLEVLPPVLAMLFLAVATDVRPQSVDSLETPLVAAGTLQNDLSVMPAGEETEIKQDPQMPVVSFSIRKLSQCS